LSSFPVFSGKVGNLEKLEDFRKQEAGELKVENKNAVADGEPFGGIFTGFAQPPRELWVPSAGEATITCV
jgi:hypothetical protein